MTVVASRSEHSPFRSRARAVLSSPTLWTVVGVVIAVFLFSAAIATKITGISPYDEAVHFDYVVKLIDTHQVPAIRSLLSPETLKEIVCRGGLPWYQQPHCSVDLQNKQVPVGGINYVLTYSPLYYTAVALIAGPLHAISGMDLFLACRLASGLIYAAGAGLLVWALSRLGASRLVAAGVTLAVTATSYMGFLGSTINPDCTSLFFGAAAIFVITLRLSWGKRMLVATLVAAVCSLVKGDFVPLASTTVLFAAIAPVRTDPEEVRRSHWLSLGWKRILLSLTLALVPVLLAGGWNIFRSLGLKPGESADGGLTESIAPTKSSLITLIIQAGYTLLAPLSWQQVYNNSSMLVLGSHVLEPLLLGGGAIIALSSRWSVLGVERTIAIGAITAMGLTILYVPTTFYVLAHSAGTQARYSMPVVPLFIAAVTPAIRERWPRWIVFALGILFWAYSINVTLHLHYKP